MVSNIASKSKIKTFVRFGKFNDDYNMIYTFAFDKSVINLS